MMDLDKFQDIIHKIHKGRAGSCSITMFHFKLSQVKGEKNMMPYHSNPFVSWRNDAEILFQRLCVGIMSWSLDILQGLIKLIHRNPKLYELDSRPLNLALSAEKVLFLHTLISNTEHRHPLCNN